MSCAKTEKIGVTAGTAFAIWSVDFLVFVFGVKKTLLETRYQPPVEDQLPGTVNRLTIFSFKKSFLLPRKTLIKAL